MERRSNSIVKEAEESWEVLGGGISRRIMGYDSQLMLVKVKFEKDAVGSLHQHIHSQSTVVFSGVFEVTINGIMELLYAGDGFYVEPNAVHGVVCKEPGILIDAFSPLREDFLK